MSDHLLVAPSVPPRIPMIRVRQISAHWALPPVDQLPKAVRSPEHTSVGMNAHDDDVCDRALFEKREQFFPAVRDGVDWSDLDRLDLMRPRVRRSTGCARLPKLTRAGRVIRERGRQR